MIQWNMFFNLFSRNKLVRINWFSYHQENQLLWLQVKWSTQLQNFSYEYLSIKLFSLVHCSHYDEFNISLTKSFGEATRILLPSSCLASWDKHFSKCSSKHLQLLHNDMCYMLIGNFYFVVNKFRWACFNSFFFRKKNIAEAKQICEIRDDKVSYFNPVESIRVWLLFSMMTAVVRVASSFLLYNNPHILLYFRSKKCQV